MSRTDELSRQHKRIVVVSLAISIGIHGFVFLANPSVSIEAPPQTVVRSRVEVSFRAPTILSVDGAPPSVKPLSGLTVRGWRKTQTNLWKHWPPAYRAYSVGGSASVRIRLDSQGRVIKAWISESSGDPAKDTAFEKLALSLQYHWTQGGPQPSQVELIQPMSVARPAVPISLFVDPSSLN